MKMINKSKSSMDDIVPPVVTAKPVRGREMITKTVPKDVFESMRLMSAKNASKSENLKPEIEKPREGTAEVYHEGFVEGKRYLVPDSNLEAMRDIVNFKMRPRRSIRYKHQTSYDVSDYDHFRKKLSHLIDKLETMPDDKSDVEGMEEHEENTEEEHEENTEEEHEENAEEEHEEKTGEEQEEKTEEEHEEKTEEEHPEKTEEEDESEEEEQESDEEKVMMLDKETECVAPEEEEEESSKVLIDQGVGDSEEEEEEEEEEEPIEELNIFEKANDTVPKTQHDIGTETEVESETESEEQIAYKSVKDEGTETDAISEEESESFFDKQDESAESDKCYVRFLISGHFKKGKKPIYIIQEYNGENLFKDQTTDVFTTSENNGDVDIRISGKFYNENILEEWKGKPVALKTKPNKIIIDRNKCKVYEDFFEDVIYMNTADIFIRGQFINSKKTNTVTPFIRFGVKRKFSTPQSNTKVNNYFYNNKKPTTIMTYAPKLGDPFSRNGKSNYGKNSTVRSSNRTGSKSEYRPVPLALNFKPEIEYIVLNSKQHNDNQYLIRADENQSYRDFISTRQENPRVEKDINIRQHANNELNNEVKHSPEDKGIFNFIRETPIYKSIFHNRNSQTALKNNDEILNENRYSLTKGKMSPNIESTKLSNPKASKTEKTRSKSCSYYNV